MNLTSFTLRALGLLVVSTAVSAQCVKTGFQLEILKASCNFTSLLDSFTPFFNDPVNSGTGCKSTAEIELIALLRKTNRTLAERAVLDICKLATSRTVLIEDIPGYGREFIKVFFNGGTKWNEEYATMYPPEKDGTQGNLLMVDTAMVKAFFDGQAGTVKVAWPDYSNNFANCRMNSAYCCWTKDRQANDHNGNCADPSDAQCIDANPADNTDLCYFKKGSNMAVFQNDDDDMQPYRAEAPIHCHGFAWTDELSDPSAIYKGNNLFFVSMYDHLNQRGYVKAVPGAPMCGCSEQMPVVSRTDCTQLEVVQSFQFDYDGTSFIAKVTDVAINYKQCTGIDQNGHEDNNDLWSHVNRLYIEGKMAEKNLVALTSQVVGDMPNQCMVAEKAAMAADGYILGYNHDTTKWVKFAGRDVMSTGVVQLGKASFAELYKSSTSKIIRRICPGCYATHQHIFYKRLTPLPSTLNLIYQLKDGRETPDEVSGNQFGVDFQIYSTYDDALLGVNPWVCSSTDGYRYSEGFPGDCGPADVGETGYQHSIFDWESDRYNVAFFLEGSDPFTKLNATSFGTGISPSGRKRSFLGSAFSKDGKIYMQSTGTDLWGQRDDFTFKYEKFTGNVEVTVKIESLDYADPWTKAGLMIRSSLDVGAKNFAVMLSGKNGDLVQYREVDNADTNSMGNEWSNDIEPQPIWIRILKQGTTFTAFTSDNGSTWSPSAEAVTLNISGDIYVGLALSANSWDGELSEAVFSNYTSRVYIGPAWLLHSPLLQPHMKSCSRISAM